MELKKHKKIIILVIALILVIAGTTVKLLKGMNYTLTWKKSVSIKLATDKTIDQKDINQIVKEVLGEKVAKIQYLDETNNEVLITVDSTEITEEEQNTLIEKINTKYEEDLSIYDIEIINNNQVKLSDILKPYIVPVLIAVIIIVLYFGFRYKTLGLAKVIENLLEGIVLPELVYFSIFAIFRIPIGIYTVPVSMLIFLISIIILIFVFDNQYKKITVTKNKNRK